VRIAAFMRAHARRTPDKTALIEGDRRIGFAELDRRSTRLAWGLRRRGVAVGDRVALCMGNCAEFVVVFAAIVKAGATCVMLNPRLARAEVGFILEDSTPAAIVHSAETRALVAGALLAAAAAGGATRYVEGEAQAGEVPLAALEAAGTAADGEAAEEAPEVPASFDDCMICYTSGTTGRPKGAIVTQSNNVVLSTLVNTARFGLSAEARQLVTTPMAHRYGFGRLMNTLCVGCSLVILPRFDPAAAAAAIERERITAIGIVPTVGRLMIDEIEHAPQKFATLTVMHASGEAFPVELKRRMLAALPRLQLYTTFALTEVGSFTCLGPAEQATHPASVGRVIPGVEVRLVDAQHHSVPQGEVGEIWVRTGEPGRFLTMPGYFRRPQETAETVRDGWIATGDLGRFDAEDYLYIVDRKKDMVLTGGYNVYSKEVEACILELAGVQDVAVIGVPDAIYGEAVAAFVELRPGALLDAEAVVAHCRERIAAYKKPKYVRFAEALPRNSTGKVLKPQLREAFGA